MHAVMICSGARTPSPRLLAHPLIDRLSVITESGHTARYPGHVSVETVEDIHDVEQVLGAAWRILSRGPVSGILAPYEVGLPAAGYVRTAFGLPGPGHDTVAGFTDKYVMKTLLSRAGLPMVPFAGAHSDEQVHLRAAELGWPVVVKPAHGGGCKGVSVVSGPREVDEWLSEGGSPGPRLPTVVVEREAEILAEYHVDGVVEEGRVRFVVTSRYLEPVLGRIGQGDPYGSYQLPLGHPDHEAIAALHARTVAALGLRSGVTHLEVFATPDGFRVSEIACRPGGGGIPAAIQQRHGVDMFDVCVRTSLGLPPLPEGTDWEDVAGKHDGVPWFGHCGLALRQGEITGMTDAEDLAALPGVARVDLLSRVGDVISGHIYSASGAGFVHLTADTEEEVQQRLAAVRDLWTIRTTPVPAAG
ncbi:ATP-grasp domain-containing protein [Streptomyces sp. NPDC002690]